MLQNGLEHLWKVMQRSARRKIFRLADRSDRQVMLVDQQGFREYGTGLRVLFQKRHLGSHHFRLVDVVSVVDSGVLAYRQRYAAVEITFSACIDRIAEQGDAFIGEALHDSRRAVAGIVVDDMNQNVLVCLT